jgi:ribonucleotide reductase alpha subunit
MKITRFFTVAGQSPYTGITFTARESQITGKSDEVIFSNKAVVVPDFWSNLATDILAQKYFRRKGVNHQHKNSLYNSKYSKKWFRFEGCIAFAETDLRQTIHRIVGCWTYWGERQKYFDSTKDAQAFYDELSYMLAKQMFAPNSPQWFNTGLHWAYGIEGKAQGHFYVDPKTGFLTESTDAYSHPQPSACFINAVEDDLVNPGGIFDLFLREARLFKQGSGAGSNMSALRGENEPLSGGGKSSGLMSWLRHGDTGAGSVKSGGTTRRAALMRILNVDHPDVEKFINWKVNEEHKVVALAIGSRKMKTFWEELVAVDPTSEKLSQAKDARIKTLVRNAKKDGIPGAFIQQCLLRYEQGDNNQTINTYDTSWEGEGYQSVSGMNSNNSVRVTDTFMKCVHTEMPWDLHNRTGGVSKRTTARDLMDQINRASFLCGDPGLQFDTTINDWHTCPEDGRINGSNPCCFVGETEVETSEGRIRFDSLEALSESGKRLPRAFSWDLNSNLPALKRIKKVWVAGETTSLVRVSTDKGLSFLCTPEHRFLLRSGEYVEARCLQPGTRLRKVGRFVNEQRSQRRYINHRTTAEHPNGTVNQAQWMWEQAYGRIPEGFEVHHISEDPTDDRLSNFELHESSEHQSLHSKGCANSRFIETDSHLWLRYGNPWRANPDVQLRDTGTSPLAAGISSSVITG